jgi:predicted P-loop ATPase
VPVDDQQREVEARRDVDAWEPLVEDWIVGRTRVHLHDLLNDCLKIEPARQDQIVQKRAGRILRALGWGNRPLRDADGKIRKTWVHKDYTG